MRRGGALRHPDRSAPRLGSRFAVATGHLCQIKFWLMHLGEWQEALSLPHPGGRISLSRSDPRPGTCYFAPKICSLKPRKWQVPKAMIGRRLSQEEAKRLLATFKYSAYLGPRGISPSLGFRT